MVTTFGSERNFVSGWVQAGRERSGSNPPRGEFLMKDTMQKSECKQCKAHKYRNGRCYADNRSHGRPIADIVSCQHAGGPKHRYKNLTNVRFGRLVALHFVGNEESGGAIWRVRCDCGVEFNASARNLTHGATRSCGCLRIDLLKSQPGRNRGKKNRAPDESRARRSNTESDTM